MSAEQSVRKENQIEKEGKDRLFNVQVNNGKVLGMVGDCLDPATHLFLLRS